MPSCDDQRPVRVGQQCVAGSCGKSANGAVCQTADGCASGFCVGASAGVLACAATSHAAVLACRATRPDRRAIALISRRARPTLPARRQIAAPAATPAFATAWLVHPLPGKHGVRPLLLLGQVENTPRTCDGQGNCRDPQLVACWPFLCSNGACLEKCTSDQDCAPENQCQPQTLNGVTTDVCGQRQNGQSCTDPGQCISGQCVDKVCCESACAGPCRSCSLASSPGRCLNVAAGAPDPRTTCKDTGATSCSTNGPVHGNGACQTYPVGTVCAPQTCVAGLHTPASTCNGSGQCAAPQSIPCNPYVCNGATCYGNCTSSNIQCATGNVCTITSSSSSCGLKNPGQDCATA